VILAGLGIRLSLTASRNGIQQSSVPKSRDIGDWFAEI
jgi:hypothetical protein